MIELGLTVRDVISKFQGVAVSRAEYLYGGVRVEIDPGLVKDGRPVETTWIDEARLVVVDGPNVLETRR